jgi:alpha-mannosidase
MMPLAGGEFPWWSGFFTSRPEFKQLFHAASATWRAVQQLHAWSRNTTAWIQQFQQLVVGWEAISLAQHHDAITGDSYDYVMEDFANYIRNGLSNASDVSEQVLAGFNAVPAASESETFSFCFNSSFVACDAVVQGLSSAAKSALLTVYNPVAWVRDSYVELLLPFASVSVQQISNGKTMTVQSAPSADSSGMYSVVFLASQLPPLGYVSYNISLSSSQNVKSYECIFGKTCANESIIITSGILTASFDVSGNLTSLVRVDASPVTVNVTAIPLYYQSKGGDENAWDFSTDGVNTSFAFPGQPNQVAQLFSGPCSTKCSYKWTLYPP